MASEFALVQPMERVSSAMDSASILAKLRAEEIRTFEGFECWACFNSGFRTVADPKGGPNEGVVRCDRCRYWEFKREST